MMISLGIIINGPEGIDPKVDFTVSEALRWFAKRHEHDSAGADLVIAFEFPGSLRRCLDWTGCKLGSFSKKRNGLLVAVAIPDKIFDVSEFVEFLIASLVEAIQLGAKFFESKGVNFALDDALVEVAELKDYLGSASAV